MPVLTIARLVVRTARRTLHSNIRKTSNLYLGSMSKINFLIKKKNSITSVHLINDVIYPSKCLSVIRIRESPAFNYVSRRGGERVDFRNPFLNISIDLHTAGLPPLLPKSWDWWPTACHSGGGEGRDHVDKNIILPTLVMDLAEEGNQLIWWKV